MSCGKPKDQCGGELNPPAGTPGSVPTDASPAPAGSGSLQKAVSDPNLAKPVAGSSAPQVKQLAKMVVKFNSMAEMANKYMQTWMVIPRCPSCKKWVSPKSGTCNYEKCPSKGKQVVDPAEWKWPPSLDNSTFVFQITQAYSKDMLSAGASEEDVSKALRLVMGKEPVKDFLKARAAFDLSKYNFDGEDYPKQFDQMQKDVQELYRQFQLAKAADDTLTWDTDWKDFARLVGEKIQTMPHNRQQILAYQLGVAFPSMTSDSSGSLAFMLNPAYPYGDKKKAIDATLTRRFIDAKELGIDGEILENETLIAKELKKMGYDVLMPAEKYARLGVQELESFGQVENYAANFGTSPYAETPNPNALNVEAARGWGKALQTYGLSERTDFAFRTYLQARTFGAALTPEIVKNLGITAPEDYKLARRPQVLAALEASELISKDDVSKLRKAQNALSDFLAPYQERQSKGEKLKKEDWEKILGAYRGYNSTVDEVAKPYDQGLSKEKSAKNRNGRWYTGQAIRRAAAIDDMPVVSTNNLSPIRELMQDNAQNYRPGARYATHEAVDNYLSGKISADDLARIGQQNDLMEILTKKIGTQNVAAAASTPLGHVVVTREAGQDGKKEYVVKFVPFRDPKKGTELARTEDGKAAFVALRSKVKEIDQGTGQEQSFSVHCPSCGSAKKIDRPCAKCGLKSDFIPWSKEPAAAQPAAPEPQPVPATA